MAEEPNIFHNIRGNTIDEYAIAISCPNNGSTATGVCKLSSSELWCYPQV